MQLREEPYIHLWAEILKPASKRRKQPKFPAPEIGRITDQTVQRSRRKAQVQALSQQKRQGKASP